MSQFIIPRPGWNLRPYQAPLWDAAMEGDNICAVWHRRAGKDEVALNALLVHAVKRSASYAYMFPESLHARRAMWQSVNPHTGRRRILETFPSELLASDPNETEMRLNLVNGSVITFFGSDNYDRMVGASLAGIVSSEHALSHPSAYAFFSPMLRENGGFFWAISTPRGRNHFLELYQHAQRTKGWFHEKRTIYDTGALEPHEVEEALAEFVSLYGIDQGQSLFEQEYEVSFNAAIMGAFYAGEMRQVRAEGRIVDDLEADPDKPVHRAWDIGVRDDTSIWWWQVVGGQVLLLDCLSQSGAGVEHFAQEIEQRRATYGWRDGIDFVPHDARVMEWGSGRTRVETMIGLGLNPQVVQRASLMDGINAVRQTLPRCVFHSRTEELGVAALEQYRREWDEEKRTYKQNPLHDWASHLCLRGTSKIATDRGEVSLKDVRVGDRVITPNGYASVTFSGRTGYAKRMVEITTGAGVLYATPEHEVFTIRGLVRADALRYDDVVITEEGAPCLWSENARGIGYRDAFTASFGESVTGSGVREICTRPRSEEGCVFYTERRSGTGQSGRSPLRMEIGRTFLRRIGSFVRKVRSDAFRIFTSFRFSTAFDTIGAPMTAISAADTPELSSCTALCGSGITGPYPKAGTSTTSTRTEATTVSRISKSCLRGNISDTTRRQTRGLVAKRTEDSCAARARRLRSGTGALKVWHGTEKTGKELGRIGNLSQRIAKCAAATTRLIFPRDRNIAGRIVNLVHFGSDEPVYDLTVEGDHCFYAEGVLVSNCDSLRYMAVAWKNAPKPKPKPPPPNGWLAQRFRLAQQGRLQVS